MNQELIERLAKEAGVHRTIARKLKKDDGRLRFEVTYTPIDPALVKFAALVAEECAKVIEHTCATRGVTIWPLVANEVKAKFPMPEPENQINNQQKR